MCVVAKAVTSFHISRKQIEIDVALGYKLTRK